MGDPEHIRVLLAENRLQVRSGVAFGLGFLSGNLGGLKAGTVQTPRGRYEWLREGLSVNFPVTVHVFCGAAPEFKRCTRQARRQQSRYCETMLNREEGTQTKVS